MVVALCIGSVRQVWNERIHSQAHDVQVCCHFHFVVDANCFLLRSIPIDFELTTSVVFVWVVCASERLDCVWIFLAVRPGEFQNFCWV